MSDIKLGQEFNYNGPAFPQSNPDVAYSDYIGGGMTLRDWFAAQALIGLLACGERTQDAATWAYAYADAMLAAREVKP
jgi:hypothetical protein